MAKSNRERVGEVLDALKQGLAPYVIRQYKAQYRDKFLQEIGTGIAYVSLQHELTG